MGHLQKNNEEMIRRKKDNVKELEKCYAKVVTLNLNTKIVL